MSAFLIPEPSTITMLVCGAVAGLVWWRRRRRS
ncbi:MAG: PEP-CTERM sorting domain-containing protein [Candidatus Nealsonbacteria bacterium]|nr:PEP-CTERM sorting domain-containing protein [Candidatus Nealsonbacteria bacterium]